MTRRQNDTRKNNPFLLSNQVKKILRSKGFTSVFNYQDYDYFKDQCKDAFNKALAIANRFIDEANPNENDLTDYIF